MILYLIECETFITIKTRERLNEGWKDGGGKEMVAEDDGEDRRLKRKGGENDEGGE